VKTALDVHPGYAQLQVPFLFGYPYTRRSGELGETDREYGGDPWPLDGTPNPFEDEAECDLDTRVAPVECGRKLAPGANVYSEVIAVSGGYVA
jgi:hypothetical protein